MTNDDAARVEGTDVPMALAYTASGEMEAQALRSALEAADIPVELKISAATKLFAVTVDGLGAVEIMVPVDRLEEAQAVIATPATPLDGETPDEDDEEDGRLNR